MSEFKSFKRSNMLRLILVVLFFIPAITFGQSVLIKKIEIANDKMIIHYELDDSNPNNTYQLNLYTSKDNFTVPMTKVTGDVGNEIKPGATRKMEWSFKEELGDYEGELSLEVRGKVFILFAKFDQFDTDKTYRRGKSYPVTWKPGSNNPVHVELYRGGERISGELNQPNNGSFLLAIPGGTKPGKDYRIKITDSKKPDDAIYSGFFSVKPKIPFVVKALGGAAIAAGAFLGLSGGGSTPAVESGIPDVPGLPGTTN